MRSVTNGRCGKWGEKQCACATRPNEPWRFQCTRAHPTRRHRPPPPKKAVARCFFPFLFYACFPALFLLLACCTNFADSSSSSSICASLDLITSERSLCEFRKKQTVIKTDGDT